jgi:hypothetical protein
MRLTLGGFLSSIVIDPAGSFGSVQGMVRMALRRLSGEWMNFHAEHHMYASVPCYNLGRLRREIDSDMPASRNMFGAWQEIIGILKRQKKNPTYQHVYALPAAPRPPAGAGVANLP